MIEKIRNPNVFGEALRDLVFDVQSENDYGCYNCFNVRKWFVKQRLTGFRSSLLFKVVYGKYYPSNEGFQDDIDFWNVYYNPITKVIVGWCWDGDGPLVVCYKDRWAINTDCKKSHGWEFKDME